MKKRPKKDLYDIEATIYCEKKTHKAIIIGKDGEVLKKIQPQDLMKYGLIKDRTKEQELEGFHIFPTTYFCPMNYNQIYDNLTEKSYSVHHFSASWFSKKERMQFLWGNFKSKVKYHIKKVFRIVKK